MAGRPRRRARRRNARKNAAKPTYKELMEMAQQYQVRLSPSGEPEPEPKPTPKPKPEPKPPLVSTYVTFPNAQGQARALTVPSHPREGWPVGYRGLRADDDPTRGSHDLNRRGLGPGQAWVWGPFPGVDDLFGIHRQYISYDGDNNYVEHHHGVRRFPGLSREEVVAKVKRETRDQFEVTEIQGISETRRTKYSDPTLAYWSR